MKKKEKKRLKFLKIGIKLNVPVNITKIKTNVITTVKNRKKQNVIIITKNSNKLNTVNYSKDWN